MDKHIIDISERPGRLSIRHRQLVLDIDNKETMVPIDSIGALVIAHPAVTLTHSVLHRVVAAGATVIVCDERSLPCGMMFPINGHSTQAERFTAQAAASKPTKKRLWQQIIRAKIQSQGCVLQRLHEDDAGLCSMVSRVRSGDPDNLEAQASRRYWPRLFGDNNFRRRVDATDQNRLLNYGYAVLRAVMARAICASGLHPCLGIHHHNRYDPFCLADDLMEPLRPIVDFIVARLVTIHGSDMALDRNGKARLLGRVFCPVVLPDARRSLFNVSSQLAQSLAAVFLGEGHTLNLPEYQLQWDEAA